MSGTEHSSCHPANEYRLSQSHATLRYTQGVNYVAAHFIRRLCLNPHSENNLKCNMMGSRPALEMKYSLGCNPVMSSTEVRLTRRMKVKLIVTHGNVPESGVDLRILRISYP